MCFKLKVASTYLEPTPGFEPGTSSLPRKCSAPELCGQFNLRITQSLYKSVQNGAGDGNRTHISSLEG